MVNKPVTICIYGSCSNLIPLKTKYCKEHQPIKRIKKPYVKKNYKFYNSYKWQKIRNYIRNREPLCNICWYKPSKCVDHIVPIEKGGSIYSIDNLQALCLSCHNRKTNKEKRYG